VQRTPSSQASGASSSSKPTSAPIPASPHRKDVLGRFGEALAVRHLRDDGMTILDRNWRCAIGEIDIVARESNTLVICEVKTRSSLRYGSPFDAVTEAKLHRLERLGVAWIRERGVRPSTIRIDVLSVLRPSTGATVVEHIRDLH
jgi:putative endonuclease